MTTVSGELQQHLIFLSSSPRFREKSVVMSTEAPLGIGERGWSSVAAACKLCSLEECFASDVKLESHMKRAGDDFFI